MRMIQDVSNIVSNIKTESWVNLTVDGQTELVELGSSLLRPITGEEKTVQHTIKPQDPPDTLDKYL